MPIGNRQSTIGNPLILGIESSCDETAASVVREGRVVLSSVVASQHDLHAKFGGVVPEIASRAHIERIMPVIDEALAAANVKLEDVGAIAVGHRPGLIGSLLVGVAAAKTLAWSLGVPLIGVDHVRAHLYAAALEKNPPAETGAPGVEGGIPYPALGLVVSGGHTALYRVESPTQMTRLGKTIDDAVGEAYDKAAAILELGFPGGPVVDKLAKTGDADAVALPRTMLEAGSLDFSFSGLKTALLYHVRGQPKGRGKGATFDRSAADLSDKDKADAAASFQKAAVDVCIAKLERALDAMTDANTPAASIVIGGGVSANSLLRSRTLALGESRGIAVRLPPMAYCVDNAAMIAGLGYHQMIAGDLAGLELEAVAVGSD